MSDFSARLFLAFTRRAVANSKRAPRLLGQGTTTRMHIRYAVLVTVVMLAAGCACMLLPHAEPTQKAEPGLALAASSVSLSVASPVSFPSWYAPDCEADECCGF